MSRRDFDGVLKRAFRRVFNPTIKKHQMTDSTKTLTVGELQKFLLNKDPDIPVYIWRGEMLPSHSIESLDHAEADPTGMGNDDSIPMPEAILLNEDPNRWAGKNVPEYESQEDNPQ